jgi:hypothetical protein
MLKKVTLESENIKDADSINEFILETVKRSLPDTLQKHLSKTSNRKEMLEKFGEKAFLNSKELKYPVINPFTEDYDCRLIYAAYVRSKQHKHHDINKKAKQLYDSQNCESEIEIELSENKKIFCHDIPDIFC